MKTRMKLLSYITIFNAVTAIVGGIALSTGALKMPVDLLQYTAFDSYVIPGLLLAVVVGGSSFIAAIFLLNHKPYARDIAGLAGIIMMGWIWGEILAIRELSWLQAIYLVTGFIATAIAWPRRYEVIRHGGRRV